MKYKLFCVDLDGTLLTDDKKIRKQDIKALRKAVDQGIKIALVTGRMPAATEPIARELGISCIMACNAGTYILEREECLYTEYLSVDTMKGIYDSIKPFGIPKTGPNKVLVGAQPELIQAIYGILKHRQDADMACSTPNYLEIFPVGMNKGKALRMICEKKGIRREETVAFGDQELDLPMLENAGVAVAMGNAIEALKERADFVTMTNNEAGIAYAIEHYLKEGMED